MSKKEIIICDVCGTTKGETNHWWKSWIEDDVFHIAPANTEVFFPPSTGPIILIKDVCGQRDGMALLNDFMQERLKAALNSPVEYPVGNSDDLPF